MPTTLSRRTVLVAGTTALPLAAIRTRPALAADFSYKLATNLPVTHPLNVRNSEAIERIKTASGGRLDITLFPNSQLGGDTDMLSQLRSGGIEFFTLSPIILSTLVPPTSISGIAFSFKDSKQALAAMDGALGAQVRGEIAKRNIVAFDRIFDNGFRQITSSVKPINTPDDLKGMKIRVPPSPLWTSLFKTLGAGPTTVNFSETYTALQTKVVDGQENPLAIIETAKLYEVQKYCSMTNHMWDGFWLLANQRAFDRLPPDLKEIAQREFARAALEERDDVAKLNGDLRQTLAARGLQFNDVDQSPFRQALVQAGFYKEWRDKYGDAAWSVLETAAGGLS
jgi:tripartite ATP-independent transporter DctP family solute receptor